MRSCRTCSPQQKAVANVAKHFSVSFAPLRFHGRPHLPALVTQGGLNRFCSNTHICTMLPALDLLLPTYTWILRSRFCTKKLVFGIRCFHRMNKCSVSLNRDFLYFKKRILSKLLQEFKLHNCIFSALLSVMSLPYLSLGQNYASSKLG